MHNSKGHKLGLRSNRNYLTNHIKSKTFHCLFMASGHTHIHVRMKVILRNQACSQYAPGLKK